MLKTINLELRNALEAKFKDKVRIGMLARKLELHLESANINKLEPKDLEEAALLTRWADDVLKGVQGPQRFRHQGLKLGIGRKLRLGPTPEQQLRSALETATTTARQSSRNMKRVVLENIPKIIHCTWAGGGAIATLKSLEGIKSWLQHTDYKVFVWWDSERLFNMHVRRLLRSSDEVRQLYDDSATRDSLNIRGDVSPGSNRHNHRFLSQHMDKLGTFEMTKELWDEVAHDLHPLEELAEQWPDRLVLADVRSKALEGLIDWHNIDLYERELTLRGMFAAAASDILRYEILYNFGGVYMDVDIELTGRLGQLQCHPDLLLAGITPDRAGKSCSALWVGRKRIEASPRYWTKCFYISNCIVAACPRSSAMQAIRETVRLGYACINSYLTCDRDRDIRQFWNSDITRSTLDLTGPNVVREVLLQCFLGTRWDEMARAGIVRLVEQLTRFRGRESLPKDLDNEDFCRIAYVWRDDNRAHLKFWTWISSLAVFPMQKVKCDTAAADRSDCRNASTQARGSQLNQAGLRKLNPYIPTVEKDKVSGLLLNLHNQHKQDVELSPDLKVGDVIWWGHSRWQVTGVTKKGTNQKRWKIQMKMLV